MVYMNTHGRTMQWRTDPSSTAEQCVMGGSRYKLTQCSLLYHACIALGVDPDTVHCPLAGAFRACTSHLPAHYDADTEWPQINYYMRGDKELVDERQGCRLFIHYRLEQDGGELDRGGNRSDEIWHLAPSTVHTSRLHSSCILRTQQKGQRGGERTHL